MNNLKPYIRTGRRNRRSRKNKTKIHILDDTLVKEAARKRAEDFKVHHLFGEKSTGRYGDVKRISREQLISLRKKLKVGRL